MAEPTVADLLAFERSAPTDPDCKVRAIWERFRWTSGRYHAALIRVIDDPDALLRDPMLVARLRRLRESQRHKRVADRLDDTFARHGFVEVGA